MQLWAGCWCWALWGLARLCCVGSFLVFFASFPRCVHSPGFLLFLRLGTSWELGASPAKRPCRFHTGRRAEQLSTPLTLGSTRIFRMRAPWGANKHLILLAVVLVRTLLPQSATGQPERPWGERQGEGGQEPWGRKSCPLNSQRIPEERLQEWRPAACCRCRGF